MMSSLAVLPSAMLARMHSVWRLRKVCYTGAFIWTFCVLWFRTKSKLTSDSLWCASTSTNTTTPLNMPNWTKADPQVDSLWSYLQNVKTTLQCGFFVQLQDEFCMKTTCEEGVLTCSLTSILCSASRMRVTACMICFPWELMIWSMCWRHKSQEWGESRRESVCKLYLGFLENLCKSSSYRGMGINING